MLSGLKLMEYKSVYMTWVLGLNSSSKAAGLQIQDIFDLYPLPEGLAPNTC